MTVRRKQTTQPSERLFADPQRDMFEKSHEEKLREEKDMPVECLGMTFENEDILALSDPPYYTACPVKSGVYFTGAIFAMSLLLSAPCPLLYALCPFPLLYALYFLLFTLCSMHYAPCALVHAPCAISYELSAIS
jgi:hypothetical protein